MRVQIQYVADRGDLSRERLVMRVRQDVDIGDFMLVRTGFEEDEVTTDVSNALWFPYERLRAGDLVVVYSKRGGSKRKRLDDGHKAHFFYWGKTRRCGTTNRSHRCSCTRRNGPARRRKN